MQPFNIAWSVLKSEKSRARAERRAMRRQENRERKRQAQRESQRAEWEAGREQRQADYEEAMRQWEQSAPPSKTEAGPSDIDARARAMIESSRYRGEKPQPPPEENPFD